MGEIPEWLRPYYKPNAYTPTEEDIESLKNKTFKFLLFGLNIISLLYLHLEHHLDALSIARATFFLRFRRKSGVLGYSKKVRSQPASVLIRSIT